ncbi:MAG: type II toxin-antitoxin system MqsA family antitoxin [Gemmatimonadales bacterium]
MKCAICGVAQTRPGTATVTLEREGSTVVMKGVPALVCPNCGEQYLSDRVSRRLAELAEAAVRRGLTVDIQEYAAV